MKKLLPILSLLMLLSACQTQESSIKTYDNITQDPSIMEKAFCEYNKGKDFITNQCDNVN